jgi:hypothetical protein
MVDETTVRVRARRDTDAVMGAGRLSMRVTRSTGAARRSREHAQAVALYAIVDGDKIPPRCFGEPLCLAASDRRGAKAYEALCEKLCRNRQVGITAVAYDGAARLAALLPIGGVLAVSLLRPEFTWALAEGLRTGARVRRTRHNRRRESREPRAAV